jgi:hypothetical protein
MTDPTGPAHTVALPAEEAEVVEAAPVASSSPVVAEGAPARRRHRMRNTAVGVLVVLTSLMVLITTIGLWAFRQVYNTDVFVGHVDSVITSPDVQASLSTYLTDQVMTAINPEQRAKAALPSQAGPLIGPVVSAIRGFVNEAVQKVVSSDQFHTAVDKAARRAHGAAIDLLEGKKVAGLTVNGNEVVFNTVPVIDQVLQQISQQGILGNLNIPPLSTPDNQPSAQAQELASKLGVTLPPDFGQIVVFKSDSLHSAQQALRLVKRGLVLLIVLTVVLIALTLLLSLHRLRTLAELGIGVAVAMLVAWAVTRRIVSDVTSQVATAAGRKTIRAVTTELLGTLRTITIILAVVGVVVALVAFVCGGSRSAAWIRGRFDQLTRPAEAGQRGGALTRAGSFVADHRDGLWVIGAGVGLVILIIGRFTWPTVLVALAVVAIWEGAVWYAVSRSVRRAEAEADIVPRDVVGPSSESSGRIGAEGPTT